LCSEAAVHVTQELMTMFGGTAFAGRLPFERYFRDARAGMVMGFANDQAYQNIAGILFPEDQENP
jgi:alkylation response protein AidB-like acyl-CoA dehydrogenase